MILHSCSAPTACAADAGEAAAASGPLAALAAAGATLVAVGAAASCRFLDARSLGDYDLEFYGLRQDGQEKEWDAVVDLANAPKFRGKVAIHDARVSHEDMMRAMAAELRIQTSV